MNCQDNQQEIAINKIYLDLLSGLSLKLRIHGNTRNNIQTTDLLVEVIFQIIVRVDHVRYVESRLFQDLNWNMLLFICCIVENI